MARLATVLTGCLLALGVASCGGEGGSSVTGDGAVAQNGEPVSAGGNLLRFDMERLNGAEENLAKYKGKVVLLVNTASQCGFTPQFDGLEDLYKEKRDKGFVILGFPADDVAGQEPLNDKQIEGFCKSNFGVTFPMFSKIKVLGDEAAPLFRELPPPTWNFNKYLLDRNGQLVENWGAETTPEDAELTGAIDAQLAKS